MKVALCTLGCRVNQSESDTIEGTLRKNGLEIVDLKDSPEYCIVNSCTVTAKSDYTTRQLIRRAARGGAKVIVTGCYSQLKPDLIAKLPGVIAVIDNSEKLSIPHLISRDAGEPYFGYYGRSRPHLKIQDGCNNVCSYCAVRLARGRSRSISAQEVIERVEQIASQGFKEVVLTGIHLGSFGHDLQERTSLSRLVRRLLLETRIARIRLSSLEINEVDELLMDLLQEERVCSHLHLPLQSGSNRILTAMRRAYSAEMYRDKVSEIVGKVPNLGLGTDIIVGFPGEEECDFLKTSEMVEQLPFTYLHVFPYSSRPGTEAAELCSSQRNISCELEHLRDLHRTKKANFMEAQLHRELLVIAEEIDADDMAVGTSGNYLKIAFPAEGHEKESLVRVRPVRIREGRLFGHVVR